MVSQIKINNCKSIAPLFKENRYDTVLLHSVLEGFFGSACADSMTNPSVARLDSGAFTILGGNPTAARVTELLHHRPIYYVTPENVEWQHVLKSEFGNRITFLPFTEFISQSLDVEYLTRIVQRVPPDYELIKVDRFLAERLPSDLNNEYFFENFNSVDDFLKRGFGYCILYKNKIISAATSMAMCSVAIDIEIETSLEFQRSGLGEIVGAQLVISCLENGIDPRWLAANVASEKLAQKLGFVKGDTYKTYEIKNE